MSLTPDGGACRDRTELVETDALGRSRWAAAAQVPSGKLRGEVAAEHQDPAGMPEGGLRRDAACGSRRHRGSSQTRESGPARRYPQPRVRGRHGGQGPAMPTAGPEVGVVLDEEAGDPGPRGARGSTRPPPGSPRASSSRSGPRSVDSDAGSRPLGSRRRAVGPGMGGHHLDLVTVCRGPAACAAATRHARRSRQGGIRG
jgi:hypothetical protein